jgi:hypothetical protein
MNKVTKESIEAKIVNTKFTRLSDKLTHCIITLANGFEITGESACVDPANYDQEIGERISYDNAFEKIWMVEGYLLQENIYQRNFQNTKIDFKHEYQLAPEESFKVPEAPKELDMNSLVNKIATLPEVEKRVLKTWLEQNWFTAKKPEQDYRLLGGRTFKTLKADACLLTPEFKEELFQEMFPGATPNDFKKLENRQVVTDELSFMEKLEEIIIEKLNGNLKVYDEQSRYLKVWIEELSKIIKSIRSVPFGTKERYAGIDRLMEAEMWLMADQKKLKPTADGPSCE